MNKNITVITYGYPNAAAPTASPFVKELVEQWKRMGVNVKVVDPLFGKAYRLCRSKPVEGVFHPRYYEYRVLKVIPFLRPFQKKLSNKSFQRAVERVLPKDTDILYAHFLNAGYAAAKISEKYGLPAYCAYGESSLWSINSMDIHDVQQTMGRITGFVSVSTDNKRELVETGITKAEKVTVFPNGVDHTLFYQHDKQKCREEFGFPQDKVIGIFVGAFIDRKGPLRVNEATQGIDNLRMIYIGTGEQVPQNDNILHCGRVLHDDIPKYLSAADFFVLPTLAEGCCNAIIEAMACGLPIISSKGEFNDDILDDAYSIRVDPQNIAEIRSAIKALVANDDLLKKMSEKASVAACDLNIESRAEKILHWMEE